MVTLTDLFHTFRGIRDAHPLVHHITNTVTTNDCANATLAVGASPVMADSPHDAGDVAAVASALVINIGTLTEETVEAMKVAGISANAHHVPVIFDPVGAGATDYRRRTAEKLLTDFHADVICGNSSEIRALAGLEANGRGVDAGDSMEGAEQLASSLAGQLGSVIAITGVTDVVSDGSGTVRLPNGDRRLAEVTGTGCMTHSLIASFAGAGNDPFSAAVGGILTMGLAGEKAARLLKADEGIGSFKVRLLDAFSTLNEEEFCRGVIENVR